MAFANTGIFEGSGHTIKLVHSEDVEMQSEDVTITPGRGPFLFNGSTMDRVEYSCEFVLHNRSKKTVAIQVGFPLNSMFLKSATKSEKHDSTDLVLRYKFIVRDEKQTYHLRFVPSDQHDGLVSIFLWDMSFQPDEVRKLSVAYEIPMAMGMSETAKSHGLDVNYAKPWYYALTPCVGEALEYVTVTGQSWAGTIQRARFRVCVEGFEQYLANRFIIERPDLTAKERAERDIARKDDARNLTDSLRQLSDRKEIETIRSQLKEEGVAINSGPDSQLSNSEVDAIVAEDMEGWGFDWHIRDCLIHRHVTPGGWREKDGTITWEFENFRPKEPLQVGYQLTLLPKTPDGMPSFIKLILGRVPKKEDLSDLREIYLAWWGIRPKSKAIREFVSDQYWYSPSDNVTVGKLTPEQKAVIAAIERYPVKEQSDSHARSPRRRRTDRR